MTKRAANGKLPLAAGRGQLKKPMQDGGGRRYGHAHAFGSKPTILNILQHEKDASGFSGIRMSYQYSDRLCVPEITPERVPLHSLRLQPCYATMLHTSDTTLSPQSPIVRPRWILRF